MARSRTVGVLGASSPLGRLVVARLRSERVGDVVGLDLEPTGIAGVRHSRVNLAADSGSGELASAIEGEDIDTLIYLGFLTGRRDRQDHHAEEITRIGRAIAQRPIQAIVLASSTTIYGALPGDPTYSDEETVLATTARSRFVLDKVDAEGRIAGLVLETDATVTVLRFAMVLGPAVPSFISDYLIRKAVPVVVDQDPSMQFVHENDVVGAIVHAVRKGADGVFNIIGDGAIPLSVALRAGRRRAAPVPELGSYPLHHALWDPDVTRAPDVLHDLFRYVWIADGAKTHEELGFQAVLSSKETVEDFYRRLG